METRSVLSHAHPHVLVELAAAKAANVEMKRNLALERAKEENSDPKESTGIGFSVLSIGGRGAGTSNAKKEEPAPESHTRNDTAQFL